MHDYAMPQTVKDRVLARMGRPYCLERLEAERSALMVVDMQNYFCAKGYPNEVPQARAIVPNINRLAAAMRAAGGTVAWVQTTVEGVLQHWAHFQTKMLTPERQARRLAGLDDRSEGYALFPELQALASDIYIKKIKYSAFIDGSSDAEAQLRARGIDTVLIAGTLTNVCCESTARDAMLRDYRVAMLSDANATLSTQEHAATLNTFAMFFGDVLTVDQAIAKLVPVAAVRSA